MAPPCDACPLYGSWLERRNLTASPELRAQYAAWVRLGGWRVLWGAHAVSRAWSERRGVGAVVDHYPRVSSELARAAVGRKP